MIAKSLLSGFGEICVAVLGFRRIAVRKFPDLGAGPMEHALVITPEHGLR